VSRESGALHPLPEAMGPLIPARAGDARELPEPARPADLLPRRTDSLRMNGSLTTPPCSEGVLWPVMKAPPQVSPGEVERRAHLVQGHDNRPLQSARAETCSNETPDRAPCTGNVRPLRLTVGPAHWRLAE